MEIDKDRRVIVNVYGDLDDVYRFIQGRDEVMDGFLQLTDPDDETTAIDNIITVKETDKVYRALMQGQRLSRSIVIREVFGEESNMIVINECST